MLAHMFDMLMKQVSRPKIKAIVLAFGLIFCQELLAFEYPALDKIRSSEIISWKTEEGFHRLKQTLYIKDFPQLANNYESQKNGILCGPTSATIVLNALRGLGRSERNPIDPQSIPSEAQKFLVGFSNPVYKRYTLNTFFNEKTDQIKSLLQIYGKPMPETGLPDYGLQLKELHQMLRTHGVSAEMRVVDDLKKKEFFIKEIADNLLEQDNYVIANFNRAVLGQASGSHFSPIAAYDPETRSFLIMDTAPLVSDWFWVSADALFNAMNTRDVKNYRGYLLVSDPKNSETIVPVLKH